MDEPLAVFDSSLKFAPQTVLTRCSRAMLTYLANAQNKRLTASSSARSSIGGVKPPPLRTMLSRSLGAITADASRQFPTRSDMRKDVRQFIRRLEALGLTVESTPGHYRVLRDGKPLRKENGMPFTLPFSPDTIRWRRAAIVELRKLGLDL
jgi:hypothetical protein